MKAKLAVLALGALSGMAAAGAYGLSAQTKKSQWDGIYTDAQATRGAALYAEHCVTCHGPDMTGANDGPALLGEEFAANWNELSVAALFERIRTTMPQDAPRSLTPPQYADIVAAMLQKGGYPAGSSELPAQTDALSEFQFLEKKPAP